MVKCIVSQIINQISDDEAYPKYYSKAAIVGVNKWIDGVVSNTYEDYCKYGWEDQPVTKYYIFITDRQAAYGGFHGAGSAGI